MGVRTYRGRTATPSRASPAQEKGALCGTGGAGAACAGLNAGSVQRIPHPALPAEEGAAIPPGSAGRGQRLWE